MRIYNAAIEVDSKTSTDDELDAAMDALAAFHPSVSTSPRGYATARISLPAEDLAQATATAVAVVERAFGGAPAIVAELMTETEFDARQGWTSLPQLVSVAEAAALLGVSRQAVQQRIDAKTLPAERVGKSWVLPRAAVEHAASGS